MKLSTKALGLALAGLATITPALAQATESHTPIDKGDTAWMMVSTALVMLMTPGLAFFYAGMARRKNALNVAMQSFVALPVVSLVWALAGYSLAFAGGNAVIGDLRYLDLKEVGQAALRLNGADLTVPHILFMAYQMMFAIITAALISGAVIERMKFGAYVAFIALWSLFVYSPMAHMVWGEGGFLFKLGALDFAGGTVVHILAGVSALVLSVLVGRRKAVVGEAAKPSNIPLTLLGTGLLWFGWFGFNGGSALASGGLSSSALVVTHLATAAASLTWLGLEKATKKKPSALGLANGAVVGLVAITPASGFVGTTAAITIGAIAAYCSFQAIRFKEKVSYDDSLDVFAVHGIGGAVGTLMVGIWADKTVNSGGANGLFFGGGGELLAKQATAVGIAFVLALVGTLIIGGALKATIGLRSSERDEIDGLDLAYHDEEGPGIESETVAAAPTHHIATAPNVEREAPIAA